MIYDFIEWPHTSSAGKPLATIENLEVLLTTYDITCHYNLATKEIEIYLPERVFPSSCYRPHCFEVIRSLAKKHRFPTSCLKKYLQVISGKRAYNPSGAPVLLVGGYPPPNQRKVYCKNISPCTAGKIRGR